MNELCIFSRMLNSKNHFLFVGDKKIYINPYDYQELVVCFSERSNYLDKEMLDRLSTLYNINENMTCKNINIPKRSVLVDGKYCGYVLTRIIDPWDFMSICEGEADLSTKLEILKRFDSIVKTMHKIGIVSCDLNPTNLLLDNHYLPHIIDLVNGQFDKFLLNEYDFRLYMLYMMNFFNTPVSLNIDNVSMHLNLLYALVGHNEFVNMEYDAKKRLIRKLKVPEATKDTFMRMTNFESLDSIPYVTETIRQI